MVKRVRESDLYAVGADEVVTAGVTAAMLARAVTPSDMSRDTVQRLEARRSGARQRVKITGSVRVRSRVARVREFVAVLAIGAMLGSGAAALHLPSVAERADASTRIVDARQVVLQQVYAEQMQLAATVEPAMSGTWWMQYQRIADDLMLCQRTFEDGSTGYVGQNPAATVWTWFLVVAGLEGVSVPC